MKRIKVQDFETGYQYEQQKKEVRKASKVTRSARKGKHSLWAVLEDK